MRLLQYFLHEKRVLCWLCDAIGIDEGTVFQEFYLASIRFTTSSGFMSNSQTVSASYLRDYNDDLGKGFWQQWQQYQDYLHGCCIKWMGGNSTDAEDALSRAMLKAWEKVQKYGGEIANFKAWLTTLTRNLCVDIHRERSRGANRVEDIEGYASFEEQGLVPSEDTPLCAMETGEKRIVIRRAIDNLPTRLRETFILHFYRELSYQEIAQQQEISYQNVCKRISQARGILREELRGYFIGEDGTDTDKSVPPTATESAIGEMSQENATVEPIVGETVTLSDSAADALPQATEVEKVEIVVSGEPQSAALSITQGDAKRQGLGKRRLIMPAVGILNLLYSQVREMRSLFELRWRVWMDSGGCWLQ
jgi:RNA polymerase sigma-70 factor (ECF subfamily)